MLTNKINIDGERRERVFAFLDKVGVQYEIAEHPPIFSQADREFHDVQIDAMIFKNLFLRNKDKSRYYLYSLPIIKQANLAALAKALGDTRLSFGGEDALQEKLNIRRGAVSFLNVIEANADDVTLLIDSSAFFFDKIGVHPNDNTATVILKPSDIHRLLNACGADCRFIALDDGEIFIEKATDNDIADILRLQYATYQSEAIIYNDFSIQPLTQTPEQEAAAFRENVVLKAVQDGRIIGSVRAYEKSGVAYIGKLMVLPGYQNRGLGKRLLQSIEGEFPGGKFELYTGSKSEKNLAFYENNGYVRFKTAEAAPGLTLVYLEKLPRLAT